MDLDEFYLPIKQLNVLILMNRTLIGETGRFGDSVHDGQHRRTVRRQGNDVQPHLQPAVLETVHFRRRRRFRHHQNGQHRETLLPEHETGRVSQRWIPPASSNCSRISAIYAHCAFFLTGCRCVHQLPRLHPLQFGQYPFAASQQARTDRFHSRMHDRSHPVVTQKPLHTQRA